MNYPIHSQASRGGRRAFTLVELVISIFIVMLVLGLAALSTRSLSNERTLRSVTAELKDFAKQARAQALLERRAFQIEFQPAFFRIQAMQAVSDEDFAMQNLFLIEGEAARAQELKRHAIPEGIGIQLRAWNSDIWMPAKGQAWVFEQSGICEPIGVRVSSEAGYIEMQFNPLTANVDEEGSEIH